MGINRLKEWGVKIFGTKEEKEFKVKGKRLDHKKALREMLTVIEVCKMDDEIKMILRMRIWGINPKVFNPMSYIDIARNLQCRVKDVMRWEDDGKHNIQEFLNKHAVVEAVDKFHKDKHFKKMLSSENRIIG